MALVTHSPHDAAAEAARLRHKSNNAILGYALLICDGRDIELKFGDFNDRPEISPRIALPP